MPTVVSSSIISQEIVRDNVTRLTFVHVGSLKGERWGPFVEHRPAEDDLQAFLAGSRASMQAAFDAPVPSKEDELLAAIKSYDDATIKTALNVTDAKVLEWRTAAVAEEAVR